MIKNLNNFLPKNLQDEIENTLLSVDFGWFYFPTTGDENSFKDNNVIETYHLTHTLYFYDDGINSPYYNLVKKILEYVQEKENIKVKTLLRIKANFSAKTHELIEYGHHVDYKNCTTSIFYVNSNDGYTIFKKNKKIINSEENKFISFNSNLMHAGTTCTDQNYRVVINFNYT